MSPWWVWEDLHGISFSCPLSKLLCFGFLDVLALGSVAYSTYGVQWSLEMELESG